MSLSLVQTPQSNNGTSATPSITLTTAPKQNNLLLCMGWCYFDAGAPVIGSGWTAIAVDTTNTEYSWVLGYKVAGAAESATQSPWTQGSQTFDLTLYEIFGQAAGVAAINGHSQLEVNAASVTCTGVTPNTAGCWGFASGAANGGTVNVPPAGWTVDASNTPQFMAVHLPLLTSGVASTPTFAWTSPLDFVEGVLVVIAPASTRTIPPWIGA